MTKLSSYQKLKKENEILKLELDAVIMRPDCCLAKRVIHNHKMEQEMVSIIMFGDSSSTGNFGILNLITNG